MAASLSNGSWPGPSGRVLFVQHQEDCPPGHVGDRIAQRGAQVEVVRADISPELPNPASYDLVVALGSYESAHDDTVPYVGPESEFLAAAMEAGVGIFGICFGAQLLSRVLGGEVGPSPTGPEVGWLTVDTDLPHDPSHRDIDTAPSSTAALVEPGPWLVWHADVMNTPPGGVELARTSVSTQAFTYGANVGVQFHPEAMYSSVQSWARTYEPTFREIGMEGADLLAQTQRCEAQARHRGYVLTDRVVDRVAALSMGSGRLSS
jgi:GMP synthase (glutamine-hydrolysing)